MSLFKHRTPSFHPQKWQRKTYRMNCINHSQTFNEQRWQFILDSRAMRQQIKTGISRESEQSYRVTGHMTDSNIMQTLPQTALSLVQWLRPIAFRRETRENERVSPKGVCTDVTTIILILYLYNLYWYGLILGQILAQQHTDVEMIRIYFFR